MRREGSPDIRNIHALLHVEDRLAPLIQQNQSNAQKWKYYKDQFLHYYPIQATTGFAQHPLTASPPAYGVGASYPKQQQPQAQQMYAPTSNSQFAGQQGATPMTYAPTSPTTPQYNSQAQPQTSLPFPPRQASSPPSGLNPIARSVSGPQPAAANTV